MSQLNEPTRVKYFLSVLFSKGSFSVEQVKELLKSEFQDLKVFTPSFNPLKEYYSKEMGQNLERVILYDLEPKERENLVSLKKWCTDLEIKNSIKNKRLVNLDIGYVAKEQVLLATGKPYSHRIYLGEGVFAELVYFFEKKTFNNLAWTYPDYQHQEKIDFFNSIR